jgi:DNA topoisomerase-1
VEGRLHKGIEYELTGSELTEKEVEKKVGGERNKLVLQPIGKMAWEFLKTVCLPLFEYDYTREMEEKLDVVAQGHKTWYELCGECDEQIMQYTQIASVSKTLPEKDIKIDESHKYTITKYGPAIVSTEDGKKVYKSARKDIDLDKLRAGELQLSDLIDEEKQNGKELGMFEGVPVYLKTGKYGMYVQWGDKNTSVKKIGKRPGDITLEKVVPLLEANKEPARFRKLNEDYSVRVGKSPYIFFKTKKMKKPKFINLKGFDEDPFECERAILLAWLETHHKIKIDE